MMESKEIQEGNKLIAEFMNLNQGWAYHENQDKGFGSTKYHSSWNWLMSVVERIEELEEKDRNLKSNDVLCTPYRVDILGRNVVEVLAFGEDSICLINQDRLTKMEAVYKAVIGFIKWYNKIQNDGSK